MRLHEAQCVESLSRWGLYALSYTLNPPRKTVTPIQCWSAVSTKVNCIRARGTCLVLLHSKIITSLRHIPFQKLNLMHEFQVWVHSAGRSTFTLYNFFALSVFWWLLNIICAIEEFHTDFSIFLAINCEAHVIATSLNKLIKANELRNTIA